MKRWLVLGTVALIAATGGCGSDAPLADAATELDGQVVRMRIVRVEHSIPDERRAQIEVVTVPNGLRGRMTLRYRDPQRDREVEETRVFIDKDWWSRHAPGEWFHYNDDELQSPLLFTPGDYVRLLSHAEDVQEKGDRHYTAVVAKRKLLDGAGAVTEARMRFLSPQVTRLPFEVWLDGDGRPQKITLTARSAGGVEIDLATEFLEIGADDDIQPPPADTIVEGP